MVEYVLRLTPSQLDSVENLLEVIEAQSQEKSELRNPEVNANANQILKRVKVAQTLSPNSAGFHEIYLVKAEADFIKELGEAMQIPDLGPLTVR